jgi:hypothetical protein
LDGGGLCAHIIAVAAADQWVASIILATTQHQQQLKGILLLVYFQRKSFRLLWTEN